MTNEEKAQQIVDETFSPYLEMNTDFRSLCAKLLAAWDEHGGNWLPQHEAAWFDALKLARAALAKQPAGPSDEELTEFFNQHDWNHISPETFCDIARTVLDCWGRPAPQPIPVAQRLPGPGDCDAQGRCWWWIVEQPSEFPHWIYAPREVVSWAGYQAWLPFHALPLPEGEE